MTREDLLARMAALTPESTGRDLTKVRLAYKTWKKRVGQSSTEPGQAIKTIQAFYLEPAFANYRKLADINAKLPHVRKLFNERCRKQYNKNPRDKREAVRVAYYAKLGIPQDQIPPKRKYVRRET